MKLFPGKIVALALMVLGVAGASDWLMLSSHGVDCNRLSPLTILATVAAFLISICVRQMGRFKESRTRWFLLVCILVAGATLFSDFRYVRRNRELCDQVQQQMRQGPTQ